MFSKKFWLTFILVFVTFVVTSYLIYGLIMQPTFQDPEVSKVFRPESEMMSKMWVAYLMDLVWSFFFVFFFAKGYENRGIMEGVRFGFYIGLFYFMVAFYQSYVYYPVPYKLVLQMFLWGLVQSVLCGIVAALVYKPKQVKAA
ncbi:MAG: hypothetical protein ACPL25_10485 [Ignavibacteria bacterium]